MLNVAQEKELLALTERYALIRATAGQTFTLASGTQTTYYFDGKRLIQTPDALPLIGEAVWTFAQQVGAVAVGGLAAGCIPIADAAVAYDAYVGRCGLRSFYVRDTSKEHGTKEKLYQAYFEIDGTSVPLVADGRRVLIVDDVLTTGSSIQQAVDEVEARGAVVAGVLVLIDRQDRRSDELKAAYDVKALFLAGADGNLSLARSLQPA